MRCRHSATLGVSSGRGACGSRSGSLELSTAAYTVGIGSRDAGLVLVLGRFAGLGVRQLFQGLMQACDTLRGGPLARRLLPARAHRRIGLQFPLESLDLLLRLVLKLLQTRPASKRG